MAVIQILRWKGGNQEDVERLFKASGAVYVKHGAESASAMRIYTGEQCGQWIAFVRFKDFAAQQKAAASIAKDATFKKLLAEANSISQFMGRDFAFDVPM